MRTRLRAGRQSAALHDTLIPGTLRAPLRALWNDPPPRRTLRGLHRPVVTVCTHPATLRPLDPTTFSTHDQPVNRRSLVGPASCVDRRRIRVTTSRRSDELVRAM